MWNLALSRVGRVEVRVWRGVERRGSRAEERSSIVSARSSVRSGRLVSGSMVARVGWNGRARVGRGFDRVLG